MLFLANDAELIRRQLHDGADLELTPGLQALLRDQISTDEITPAYICFFYDETLGEFPYLGLEAAGDNGEAVTPIERGTVRAGRIRLLGGREAARQGIEPRNRAPTPS